MRGRLAMARTTPCPRQATRRELTPDIPWYTLAVVAAWMMCCGCPGMTLAGKAGHGGSGRELTARRIAPLSCLTPF